ncbi:MAG: hypothetical protein C0500_05305 [Sphingobium sp.]|nr:hypothetical protein [Sphingobium sp.]
MAKTNWRRIGLVATILFVPGGFLLGASMAARRMRKDVPAPAPPPSAESDGDPPATDPAADN